MSANSYPNWLGTVTTSSGVNPNASHDFTIQTQTGSGAVLNLTADN